MTTRHTIDRYFAALTSGDGWQDQLADQAEFTNHADPVTHVTGRGAYIDSTRGFYAMADSIDVDEIIIDDAKACVRTRYLLQPPRGEAFTSHVAEIFTVADDQIQSLAIYFDTAPYPTPPPATPDHDPYRDHEQL